MPVTSRARRRRLSAPRSAPASSRSTFSRRTTRRSNLVFTVGLIATAVLLSNRSLTQKDDNRLLCFCTARPHLARHPAKGLCRQDLGARQARHDPRVQPVHLADPAVGLHRRDGHHQRRDEPPRRTPTPQAIINAWKMSIWRVMKLSWVVSTVSMAIAQRFLAPEIWGAFSTLGRGSHPTCGRTDLLYLAQCRSSPYVQVEPTELSDQREDFLELTRLPLGTAYRPVRWNSHQHPGEP